MDYSTRSLWVLHDSFIPLGPGTGRTSSLYKTADVDYCFILYWLVIDNAHRDSREVKVIGPLPLWAM